MTTNDLDKFDKDALMRLWGRIHRHPVIEARKIFPERPKHYVRATHDLGAYAANRAAMLSCESKGDERGALVYRRICDIIRGELPECALP